MNIFELLGLRKKESNTKSATTAKERLQLVLAHDGGSGVPTYLEELKRDIILVVTKHLNLPEEQVHSMINVEFESQEDTSFIELNIELPEANAKLAAKDGESSDKSE